MAGAEKIVTAGSDREVSGAEEEAKAASADVVDGAPRKMSSADSCNSDTAVADAEDDSLVSRVSKLREASGTVLLFSSICSSPATIPVAAGAEMSMDEVEEVDVEGISATESLRVSASALPRRPRRPPPPEDRDGRDRIMTLPSPPLPVLMLSLGLAILLDS